MRPPNTIDFWRGVALMEILVNHIPGNSLSRFTHRQYGWSDAAEVLIFLAGIAFAMRCGKQNEGGEWRRIFNIYIWHVVFSFVLIGVYYFAHLNGQPNILAENRTAALNGDILAGLLLLTHHLRYFDILPLYIVLFATGPLIAWLAQRSLAALACSSFALYAATRIWGFGLPTWPEPGLWYFNPFAWQALFVIGYVCGARREALARIMQSRALLVAASVVLFVAFVAMLAGVPNEKVHERTAIELMLWGKSSLGPMRILHFLALALVAARFGRFILPFFPLSWTYGSMLGRYAMPTFCLGALFSALGQIAHGAGLRGIAFDSLLFVVSAIALLLTAALLRVRRRRAFMPPMLRTPSPFKAF
jgi:hypothetical protein